MQLMYKRIKMISVEMVLCLVLNIVQVQYNLHVGGTLEIEQNNLIVKILREFDLSMIRSSIILY